MVRAPSRATDGVALAVLRGEGKFLDQFVVLEPIETRRARKKKGIVGERRDRAKTQVLIRLLQRKQILLGCSYGVFLIKIQKS